MASPGGVEHRVYCSLCPATPSYTMIIVEHPSRDSSSLVSHGEVYLVVLYLVDNCANICGLAGGHVGSYFLHTVATVWRLY